MSDIGWKTGFEIELLAPAGKSRRDLAQAIAQKAGGHAKRCFYPQSEPSVVEGTPVFENLILGFNAYDLKGDLIATCVDDLTIRHDLDQMRESLADWYRIVSDDARLLRLVMAQCDPDADRQSVLLPVADLFGTDLVEEDDLVRLADSMSAPIALAASLPGERERPCELITPPIEVNHRERLQSLLIAAEDLGFTVPVEAAVHVHFDAQRLCNAQVFSHLVQALSRHGPQLRRLVSTNPNCVRLAPVPTWLTKVTKTEAFQRMEWGDACALLKENKLSKYCDYNFLNLVHAFPGKNTFEVRIFPGSMDAAQIVEFASLFEAILNWCIDAPSGSKPERRLKHFIAALPLSADSKQKWLR